MTVETLSTRSVWNSAMLLGRLKSSTSSKSSNLISGYPLPGHNPQKLKNTRSSTKHKSATLSFQQKTTPGLNLNYMNSPKQKQDIRKNSDPPINLPLSTYSPQIKKHKPKESTKTVLQLGLSKSTNGGKSSEIASSHTLSMVPNYILSSALISPTPTRKMESVSIKYKMAPILTFKQSGRSLEFCNTLITTTRLHCMGLERNFLRTIVVSVSALLLMVTILTLL